MNCPPLGTADSSYSALKQVRKIYTHLYSMIGFVARREVALQMQQVNAYVAEQPIVIASSHDLGQPGVIETIIENTRNAWRQLTAPPSPDQVARPTATLV